MFLKGRIIDVQGVVNSCAPAIGWEMGAVSRSAWPHYSIGKGHFFRSIFHLGSSEPVGSNGIGSGMGSES